MALPRSGGGFQVTEGNTKEAVLRRRFVTAIAAVDYQVIAAEALAAGMVTFALNVTLPTAADIDKVVSNATPNHAFDVDLINTSGAPKMVVMGAGLTNAMGANLSAPANGNLTLRFLKTGPGAYTVYAL